MNGDGIADDTGWVGKGEGILVLDKDNDNRVTRTNEISMLGEKAGANSSFDALTALDANSDRVLDAKDARFGQLKVWVDANRDGRTQRGELSSLADLGIVSLSLTTSATSTTGWTGDDIVLSTATFKRGDGSTGTTADVALSFKPGGRHGGSAVAQSGLTGEDSPSSFAKAITSFVTRASVGSAANTTVDMPSTAHMEASRLIEAMSSFGVRGSSDQLGMTRTQHRDDILLGAAR